MHHYAVDLGSGDGGEGGEGVTIITYNTAIWPGMLRIAALGDRCRAVSHIQSPKPEHLSLIHI